MTRIDLLSTALGLLSANHLTTMDGALLCALMRFSNAHRGQLQRIIKQPMHATSMQNLVTRGLVTTHRPSKDKRRYALTPKGVTMAHNLLGVEEPAARKGDQFPPNDHGDGRRENGPISPEK